MKKVILILDPAGGWDNDLKSPNGLISESRWSRFFCFLCEPIFKEAGIDVDYTVLPDDPDDRDILERKKIANQIVKNNPDRWCIFVSVHMDATEEMEWTNKSGFRCAAFTEMTWSELLSEFILKSAYDNLPEKFTRFSKTYKTEKDLEILNGINCPAVLFECGFLNNKADTRIICSFKTMTQLAYALRDGIVGLIEARRKAQK